MVSEFYNWKVVVVEGCEYNVFGVKGFDVYVGLVIREVVLCNKKVY